MKKYIYVIFIIFLHFQVYGQCLTTSLIINTGYNTVTRTAIAGSGDHGTPVPDPHWLLTAVSAGTAAAILADAYIPVVLGANADVITGRSIGGWVTNPTGFPGDWITSHNGTTYISDGTGPTGTEYSIVLTRPFTMCSDDSVTLDLYIANDNYIDLTDVDGVPLLFAQPALPTTTNYSMYSHTTQTIFLTAGTHNLNIYCKNYNLTTRTSNPTGINIYGTVSSATGTGSIVTDRIAGCATHECTHTCGTLTLPDTMALCYGASDTIRSVFAGTDSIITVSWSDTTGLSDTTVIRPVVTATASGWRTLTIETISPENLVANGDFSAGNTDFRTAYILEAPGPSSIPDRYAITTDPSLHASAFPSFGDHTSGTGEMLLVDGSLTAGTIFWQQKISVIPATDYIFSFWTALAHVPLPSIEVRINGVVIGVCAPVATAGVWTQFRFTWNSALNTVADLTFSDLVTTSTGNDFLIDDIAFQQVCAATDSVYLNIAATDTTTFTSDTGICASAAPLRLAAPSGYASYRWNTGSTAATIAVSSSGRYYVSSYNLCVLRVDTFNVRITPMPVVTLGNDTAICIGDTLMLRSVQPPGYAMLWSTGSMGDEIEIATTGTYWLRVDTAGCVTTDTVNILVSPYPLVDIGPDTLECNGNSILLQSTYTYTAPYYLWSTGNTSVTETAVTTGRYWLQVTVAGCMAADTISVTILHDTFTLYNPDTAVCAGAAVQVRTTGYPLLTYIWRPTTGIPNPYSPAPLILTDTSAMYVVTASLAGCPDIVDSFFLEVQPLPSVFVGGNRRVCEFEQIFIRPSVTPGWYPDYIYSWSPGSYIDDVTAANVIFTAGQTTGLRLIVTTPAGCTGVDSADIFVYPGNIDTLETPFHLCPGDSLQLKPHGTAVAYDWAPAYYLSDTATAAPWVKPISTQTYTLIVTSADGCRDTLGTTVIVHPAAVLDLGNDITLYPGESYHISPTTNCVNFSWFPPYGLSNAYIADPVVMPDYNTVYVVTANTEWNCMVTDSVSITADPETLLAVPNAFAPGSGRNNRLYVLRRGIATLKHFRIFDRWGVKVFEATDIDAGWDGTYNGTPQPLGVYVYQIEAVTSSGAEFRKTGNVTLIR